MTFSSPARKVVLLVLALGLLAVATAHAATSHKATLQASKTKLAFNKKTLTVAHGKVTILMKNPSSFPHGIAVEGHGVDKDGKTVNQGGTSKLTLRLKKGTYEFYCPVPGHKAAGMKGKLIVK